MKRWMISLGGALLLAAAAAAPAGACACGGEPYSPWRDRANLLAPVAVAGVTGWLGYKAFRRKSAKQ